MKNRVIVGRFNAEQQWEDENRAMLPFVNSPYYNNTIKSMDELLTVFCKREQDIIVTETKMNESFLFYLKELNIIINNFNYQEANHYFNNMTKEDKNNYQLDPYAYLREHMESAEHWGIEFDKIPYKIIKEMNSKIYSVELSQKQKLNDYSKIVRSLEDYENLSKEFVKCHGKFIIKEAYGVSGKGNRLISNERERLRYQKIFQKQKNMGRKIEFILEPHFEKELDFSTQAYINKEGKITMISIQEVLNHNFSYEGSIDMQEKTLTFLKENNYFSNIDSVLKEVYEHGYHGDVCIDSMITKDKRIIPIIEINARKSMSLIKAELDKKMGRFSEKNGVSCIWMKDMEYASTEQFDDLLYSLKKTGLLFVGNCGALAMPISCNTLYGNRNLEKEHSRGRIYCYAAASERKELLTLLQQLEQCLLIRG